MNMKKALTLLTVTVLILAAAALIPAAAQDELTPDAEEATFGEVSLTNGFVLDPFIISAIAGGNIEAFDLDLGEGCVGTIAAAPDVRLTWSHGEADTSALRIFFTSLEDTTLVIQTPGGEYVCNDDSTIDGADAFSPAVDFVEAEEGTYNIWIGTYTEGDPVPGYLMVTQFVESYPGQVVSDIIGDVVTTDE